MVVDSVFVSVVVAASVVAGAVFRLSRCALAGSGVSAGAAGAAGAVTSVFCSHAPKSAAVARMQSIFFMDCDVFYMGTKFESVRKSADSVYGLGLDDVVVVVVSVFFSAAGAVVTVLVVSLVFSVEAGGFTIVVLFSVFFSAGAAGATVSVFCSHAPRSAALARMQSNFFIVMDWLPVLGLCLIRSKASSRPC